MTPGTIAAIVVCRDLGRTLDAALDSIESQTRPPMEIVIVDDRSTDIYTRQVLARIERQGTRVLQAGGLGASGARNLGARLTSADYIVWLDADDTLEPGYFDAAGVRLDAQSDLDFVSCAMRAFEGARYVWKPAPPTFVDAIATGGVPHASTMMRRTLWEAVGGFDETLQSFELLDFWASVLERGVRGVILDEPLLNYRVRAGSGYRRSIQPGTYLARLRHFYAKHRAAVEGHGIALINAKEAFLVSQREYKASLESKKASLTRELAGLRQNIDEAVAALESHGVSRVNWGDLKRVQPLSQQWGRDRGTAIDRHYIEKFLDAHRADIHGRVLEVRDSIYTRRFGGDAVTTCDVIDRDGANGLATVIADLRRADAIGTGTYDCIILTQTLQLVDDIAAVLGECARILRPGGVLLATAPSVIRVDDEAGLEGDFWRLTEASARQLFADVFPVDRFDVSAYGNVMACAAFLYGASVEEMAPADLDHADPTFPLVIAIRAVKPERSQRPATSSHEPYSTSPSTLSRTFPAAILAYHRIADLTPDSHALCTPSGVFREQMEYIRREYSPIGLEDLVRAAAAGRIPERAVAITFDDGYLDALTAASPILTALGIPATFFVNTDRLSEEHERWWDILERVFLSGPPLPPVLTISLGGHDLALPTATSAERSAALECLNRTAWPLEASGRSGLVADVLAWSHNAIAPRSTHRVLTSAEVLTLASRPGHSIGAHTIHHLALTTQSAETRWSEVRDDKLTLERAIDRPVHLFAYPYGDFDAGTVATVRKAGFFAAFTVETGLVSAGANRFLLPRCEITAGDRDRFPARLREIFAASAEAPIGIP
jgi:peptidoglycan/xylan/chitin deacetylase (PgdA/CDA1 family)/glycosyltransferase involved in cell wall biosynthesis